MKIWIYVDGRQQGPFELEELLDKPVTESTKVWYEGLPKWYPAGYLEELRPLFDGTLARRRAIRQSAQTEVRNPEIQTEPEQKEKEEETRSEILIEERDDVTGEQAPAQPVKDRYEVHKIDNATDESYPPTYLGWTIFLTICCCSPVSIASLVTAILTSSYNNSGNLPKARKLSEATAWLIMIAIALGFFSFFLWDIIF